MILARREFMGGAGVIAAIGLGVASTTCPAPAIAAAALVPAGADLLLLHAGGGKARALVNALEARPRPGRTAERRIALFDRDGFAVVADLINRMRGVHVVALADAAQLMVLEIMVARAGATPRRAVTASGDNLVIAQF